MSRYTLARPGDFAEVVFGWDEASNGFFLQCFADAADEAPSVWRSDLAVHELRSALGELELELSDLAARMLEADARGVAVLLASGDPALWRGSSGSSSPPTPCTIIEQLLTFARVRWPNGEERLCIAAELEPDLIAAGVV